MTESRKSLVLIGNNVSSEMRTALENCDSFVTIPRSIGFFASGESFTELFPNDKPNYDANAALLRGAKVTIAQSTGGEVSASFIQLTQMIHTLKDNGAKEVTVAMPFAAFDRQDRKFDGRFVSRTADLIPKLLKVAGADKVITITPHSQAAMRCYKDVFGENNYTALSTTELVASDIKKRFGDITRIAIGAPDGADKPLDEGQKRAHELAEKVFGDDNSDAHLFKISKMHTAVSTTKILGFEGDVKGKDCACIDDMVDGGSTMINAGIKVKQEGARSYTAYFSHPIFSKDELGADALEKLLTTKVEGKPGINAIDNLVFLDTIPDVAQKIEAFTATHPELADRISVLSAAPLLIQEMERQQSQTAGFTARREVGVRRQVGG